MDNGGSDAAYLALAPGGTFPSVSTVADSMGDFVTWHVANNAFGASVATVVATSVRFTGGDCNVSAQAFASIP